MKKEPEWVRKREEEREREKKKEMGSDKERQRDKEKEREICRHLKLNHNMFILISWFLMYSVAC